MRYYRIQCGLTQQQVADALNINRTTYTKYETGVSEPSHELLGKIVKMFGIDYNAILDNRDYFERRVADSDMTLNVLTLAERAIITRFRSMSKEDQKKICEYIDMLYNEKTKKIL
jgi:DNA-binding XRE family transcriptional regulator